MRTIRVYGDSFAAPSPEFDSWADILGQQLSLPVINKAINGSSTEYAIKNLCVDIKHNLINDDDIIIFVVSTPGRLHLEIQNKHHSLLLRL